MSFLSGHCNKTTDDVIHFSALSYSWSATMDHSLLLISSLLCDCHLLSPQRSFDPNFSTEFHCYLLASTGFWKYTPLGQQGSLSRFQVTLIWPNNRHLRAFWVRVQFFQGPAVDRSSGVISRNYSQEAKDGMHKDLAHGPWRHPSA